MCYEFHLTIMIKNIFTLLFIELLDEISFQYTGIYGFPFYYFLQLAEDGSV